MINEIRLQQLSVAGFLEALAAALFLSAPSPSPSQQLSQVGNPSSYQSGISDVRSPACDLRPPHILHLCTTAAFHPPTTTTAAASHYIHHGHGRPGANAGPLLKVLTDMSFAIRDIYGHLAALHPPPPHGSMPPGFPYGLPGY